MTTPSGEHHELLTETASGRLRAVIGSVAAGIRHLSIDGVDLVPSLGEHDRTPLAAGLVLVPWPNRIRDGRWELDGAVQQLALTEPDRFNAIHGLLRYSEYRELARSDDSVTLGAGVFPQSGYPFLLQTAVHYELVSDGLAVTHAIENSGEDEAPVAVGAHPFLKIGDVSTASLELRLAASSYFEVDDRMIPTGEVPVDGTPYDLRGGRAVGELELDTAFGEVLFDGGEAVHSLTAHDGRSVAVWAADGFDYVQVFTTREFPGEEIAIAVEPMTAPANAFNSGKGVRWLAPGERWELRWGIRFSGFGGAE